MELQTVCMEARAAGGYAMIDDSAERLRVDVLSRAMERISAAPHGQRGGAFEEAALVAGVSAKRLHNLYTAWKRAKTDDERILALADGRKLAAASRPNPWLPVYKRYCENDKNTDRGGWEAMRRDFLAGTLTVPGVGNWIQAWQAENAFGDISELRDPVTGALRPPEGWMPRGATYGNLSELARRDPDRRFNLAFNRQGRRAAHRFLLPVLQSRAGVTVGEITQFDDVWLNDDVIVDGRVCRPLAFVGYDYASAYQCARAMKPRVRNEETGRMKNLNEYDFRCLLACHCCRTGFWRRRARFVLEHGTTAIRNDRTTPVRDNIMATARLLGFNVELCESGILSEQAHAGLLKGCGGGNFRMKALCEGSHNVLHNALASLPGSHGRDAEHLHESNAALVKYEQWLLDAAGALDPVFAAKLVAGLQTWGEYEAAYDTICREVMKRSDHRLEGWGGRMVREVCVGGRWVDATAFAADSSPEDVALMGVAVRQNPKLIRDRPMSRLEAWHGGVKDLRAKGEWAEFPLIDMAAFFTFNPRAGRPFGDWVELAVRDNGLVGLRDGFYFGRDELLFRAVVKDRRGYASALPPGKKVLVLVNPLMPDFAVFADPATRNALGVAARHDRAPAYDRHAIEAAMGAQAHDLAGKVLPMRGRHQDEAEERAARMAHNLCVIKEAGAAKAAGPQPDGEGYGLDELNEADDDFSPADGTPCGSGLEAAGEEAFSLDELASV